MSRPEERGTETDPADRQDGEDGVAEGPEPVTPPIDEDVAGSVNAAVHETDDE